MSKSSKIATFAAVLGLAYTALQDQNTTGKEIKSITIDAEHSNLDGGVLNGMVNFANRSRKPVAVKVNGSKAEITFCGKTATYNV